MNDKIRQNERGMPENNGRKRTAKECAYLAVFVALTIGAQLAFSAIPGIEVVTVLFVAYSFVFGARRGMLAAMAFSLLRQFVFGFFVNVLVLYLLYYNLLAFVFGMLGRGGKTNVCALILLTALACVFTVFFTLTDNLLTAFWYGLSGNAARVYFSASIPVMVSQTVCTAVTVGVLFLPLQRVFSTIKKGM